MVREILCPSVLNFLLMLGAVLLALGEVWAADVPPTAEPERIDQRYKAPTVARSILEPIIPENAAALTSEKMGEIRFPLMGIAIVDLTTINAGDLARYEPLYQERVGKEVDLKFVLNLVGRINTGYEANGEAFREMTLPPQTVRDGIVRLTVRPRAEFLTLKKGRDGSLCFNQFGGTCE